MKKVLSVILSIIMLTSVVIATSIFAWYRANTSSKADVEHVTTVNKTVNVTMMVKGDVVNKEKIDEKAAKDYQAKTVAPEKGFYPIVPKEAGKFLYNDVESAVWQMGSNNKVVEIKSKNDKDINGNVEGTSIGKGQRAYSQMDNITFDVNTTTDRIFYPKITIADNEFSNGLSCALFAVDVNAPTKYELVAYSDYYFGYSPVSKRSSKLIANANAFVIQKNRTIQMTLLTWLDASKADAVNIYREASVTVELNSYDNFVFDNQGYPYREHYTDGFNYKLPTQTVDVKNTGLNEFTSNYAVNADQTEIEHDENGNRNEGTLVTRIPSYYLHTDGIAYPVVVIEGKVAGVKKLTIPQSVTTFPTFSAEAKNSLEELILDGEFAIGNSVFRGWTKLKKLYIGPKMLRIGQRAFENCTGITEITMEGGTYLDQYCFAGTKFEEISLPYTIKEAYTGGNTEIFKGNDKLRHVFIDCPTGQYTFNACSSLETIIFGPNVKDIPSKLLNDCLNLKSIVIGDNVTKVGSSNSCPFQKCSKVTDLVIGKSASIFVSGVFADLSSLKNVTMPGQAISTVMNGKEHIENVTITTGDVPPSAFSGKTSIQAVTIHGDVKNIGAGAFSGCTGLRSLNVLELGNWCQTTTFGDAEANPLSQPNCQLYINQKEVNDLVIPSTYADANGVKQPLTTISSYSFYNCDAITSLKIPQSVTSIEANAFAECGRIKDIVTPASAVNNIPFIALENLEIVDKDDATESTLSATIEAANLKTIKIGETVNAAGVTFSGCNSLTKAIVPATALANLPESITDLTVLDGEITSEVALANLKNLRIEEGVTGVGDKFSGRAIESLAITSSNLNLLGADAAKGVLHLEIIDTLSKTKKETITITKEDGTTEQKEVTRVEQTIVSANDINKFTSLQSIKISDYTTIQGTISITTLTKAIVSGNRIGEILGATNTATQSKITELEVVSGTISQRSQDIPATGFSFWRGITNATLTIKDGVIVEDGAFFGCNAQIGTATIPANALKPMFNFDYRGADALTSVTITSGNIPDNAFDTAPNITNLVVSSGVTGVGESAFDGITKFNDTTNPLYNIDTDPELPETERNVKYLGNADNPYHIAVGVTDINVNKISLNENCKYVAEYAFAGTLGEDGIYSGLESLTEVYIPSATRLTDNAFLGRVNKIETMTAPASALAAIPSSVETGNSTLRTLTVNSGSITRQALANFTALEHVTLQAGVTTINDFAFQNCTALDILVIENPRINIASNAFEGSINIHKATMPASVIEYIPKNELVEVTITSGEIEEYAFENVGLVKITLEIGVTDVKYHAFDGCNSVAVLVNNSTVTTNLPTHKATSGDIHVDHTTGIVTYNSTTIMRYVGNGGLYTVGSDITEIGQYAFYNRDKVVVDFSNATNLKTIGAYAFYGGEAIKKLDLSSSTNVSIGAYAFYRCTNLYEANLPSVTTVGEKAFYGCGRLISVNAPGVLDADKTSSCLTENAQSGATNITDNGTYITYDIGADKYLLSYYGNAEIFYTPYVKGIYKFAFYNQNNLKTVVIAPSVEKIGDYAFVGCVNLEKVTFSNQTPVSDGYEPQINEIGNFAFKGCVKLKSFDILYKVTIIGVEAFAECEGLGSITFEAGSTLTEIKDRAFMCSGITSLNIPNSVTTIGIAAFYKCDKLQTVTVGSSVTSIGKACFFACYNLGTVTFSGTGITEISDGMFDDCVKLTTITLPSSVTKIGNYAFDGCLRLTGVTVQGTITSVGDYAFHNCENLTQKVPNTGAEGKNAYLGCEIPGAGA